MYRLQKGTGIPWFIDGKGPESKWVKSIAYDIGEKQRSELLFILFKPHTEQGIANISRTHPAIHAYKLQERRKMGTGGCGKQFAF